MVVSQFLTKDLFIDWTWGEKFLESTLLTMMQHQIFMDGNGLLLQVTDAVPYFRMFNPIRQSERFDAKALYIKTYLPIFNQIDAKYLHDTQRNESNLFEQGLNWVVIIQDKW